MSVTVRPYGDEHWEVDIRLRLPNGDVIRERRKAPVASRSSARRWGRSREHVLLREGKPKATSSPRCWRDTTSATCGASARTIWGLNRVVAQFRSGHGPIPVLFGCYRIRTDSGMPRLDIRFSTSHLMMASTR